jgi:hypothetical protein
MKFADASTNKGWQSTICASGFSEWSPAIMVLELGA